ncbi:hypothetical protein BGZ83_008472 [Gryganskiella cystojenkinii]|nr:hypothetical protein BGZ83_008472 [Gryganskiella cystojenkinii]
MVTKTSFVLTVVAALSYCTSQVYAQLVVPPQTLVANIDMNDIEASFRFSSLPSGPGAKVEIEVTQGLSTAVLPSVGFEYHIHENPVGPNNNCAATGSHLDPAKIGAAKCNPNTPIRCQEGDLSGKHGNLKATESDETLTLHYIDKQIQFSGATTTIVGRSIVIHNNGTRVACGNLVDPNTDTAGTEPDNATTESIKATEGAAGKQATSSGVRAISIGSWEVTAMATTGFVGLLTML